MLQKFRELSLPCCLHVAFCNGIHNLSLLKPETKHQTSLANHRLEGFELADSFTPLIMAGDRLGLETD